MLSRPSDLAHRAFQELSKSFWERYKLEPRGLKAFHGVRWRFFASKKFTAPPMTYIAGEEMSWYTMKIIRATRLNLFRPPKEP